MLIGKKLKWKYVHLPKIRLDVSFESCDTIIFWPYHSKLILILKWTLVKPNLTCLRQLIWYYNFNHPGWQIIFYIVATTLSLFYVTEQVIFIKTLPFKIKKDICVLVQRHDDQFNYSIHLKMEIKIISMLRR